MKRAATRLFGFDPQAAKTRLEALSWVRQVTVERRLPGTVIYLRVEERHPARAVAASKES